MSLGEFNDKNFPGWLFFMWEYLPFVTIHVTLLTFFFIFIVIMF